MCSEVGLVVSPSAADMINASSLPTAVSSPVRTKVAKVAETNAVDGFLPSPTHLTR